MGLIYKSNFSVHSQLNARQVPAAQVSVLKCLETPTLALLTHLKVTCYSTLYTLHINAMWKITICATAITTYLQKEQSFHLPPAPFHFPKNESVLAVFKGILKLTYPNFTPGATNDIMLYVQAGA